MKTPLDIASEQLSEIQRQAVHWGTGALLVLAGPGSGKTQVLTARIAHLLHDSASRNFRVLALTFTNKAADEMRGRVSQFVPGLEERANICTFHGFCAQVLRQHGVHVGIEPTFAIYSDHNDRTSVLEDALRTARMHTEHLGDTKQILGLLDRLKEQLVLPADAETRLGRYPHRAEIAAIYQLYENELRKLNALDFNSLIYETYQLLKQFPAIAASYRKSHPHWLIDEFQDTNTAQYRLVRALAGNDFRNVVSVADDDQIIYQWNGANFQQIQSFNNDFAATVIQLPTNYRCPPAIVEAANRLVVYNAQRTKTKEPLKAAKTGLKYPAEQHLTVRVFESDTDEANGIAEQIAGRGAETWGGTAVLARNKALLEGMRNALGRQAVPSAIAQRRDDFLSAEFRWLAALLKQQQRPLDRRNMAVVIEAFNRCADLDIPVEQVLAEGEMTGGGFVAAWVAALPLDDMNQQLLTLVEHARRLIQQPADFRATIDDVTAVFDARVEQSGADLSEDLSAWREISKDLTTQLGKNPPLEQFLQELQLRSKEPTPKDGTVTLMTIHGSKGREFDVVHVIGLVEEIMPSFQSLKKGDGSPEMEEERRNCFVAITRTRECLVLSHAGRYGRWPRKPSRFLLEMGLIAEAS
jgi:DNA helicase-2/ATP-dependent DNA helicase PcrA